MPSCYVGAVFSSRRLLVTACLVTPVVGGLFAACTFPDATINPDADCRTDSECVDQGGLLCDDRGLCVMCLQDADCASGHCDLETSGCLECVGDGDCEGGQRCATGICVECVGDADCDGVCSDFRCVECADQQDCPQGLCADEICVACTDNDKSHCPSPSDDLCVDGVCRPMHCSDATTDDDETDQDCGGSCPPCEEGEGCMVDGDCQTKVCDAGTCAPCSKPEDCGAEAFCQGGACLPLREVGESCPGNDSCVENAFCVDGICCESECDGTCMGCSEFDTGAPDGQCTQALPDTPCTAGPFNGKCTASGTCNPINIGG